MKPSPDFKGTLTILGNKARLLDPSTPAETVEAILREAFEDDEDIVATLLEIRRDRFGAYAAMLDETLRTKEEIAASQEASRAARRKLEEAEAEASAARGRGIGQAVTSGMESGCFRAMTLAIAFVTAFGMLVGRRNR